MFNMETKKTDKAFILMEQVRLLLELLDVKQKDLSKKLNIPRTQLNRYLSCRNEMKTNNLVSLLEFVGIDLLQFVNGRISELTGNEHEEPTHSAVQAKLDRMQGPKKDSLLKIIDMMRE